MSGFNHYTTLGFAFIAIAAMAGALAFGLWSLVEAAMGKGDDE